MQGCMSMQTIFTHLMNKQKIKFLSTKLFCQKISKVTTHNFTLIKRKTLIYIDASFDQINYIINKIEDLFTLLATQEN